MLQSDITTEKLWLENPCYISNCSREDLLEQKRGIKLLEYEEEKLAG